MAEVKTLMDSTYYLVVESDGDRTWYEKNPSFLQDRDKFVVNIEDRIFEFLGEKPTLMTPAKVRFKAVIEKTTEKFNIGVPGEIRSGEVKYVRDLDGKYVEIVERRNSNPDFPLNGIVLASDGSPVGARMYNGKGECSDGEPSHSLVVVRGESPLK